jgi:hypothetical protein
MTANRIIPYGYVVQNGETRPHPQESEIVRRIYRDYLDGNSYLRIAQRLTAEGIEFLPKRHDWNKNRVKRILEDTRYRGSETYPEIIGGDLWRRVWAAKDSPNKGRQKSEMPQRLPCPVVCVCGEKMARRHDSRNPIAEHWLCPNPDCKRVFVLSDGDLLAEITALLNALIADPNSITITTTAAEIPPEIRRQQNEVNRQLDGVDFDKDSVKTAIFALAAAQFRAINVDHTLSHMMRAEFASTTELSAFSETLFKKTVRQIGFNENGAPCLFLKNNQRIERSDTNASDSDTDSTSAQDHPQNPRQG